MNYGAGPCDLSSNKKQKKQFTIIVIFCQCICKGGQVDEHISVCMLRDVCNPM